MASLAAFIVIICTVYFIVLFGTIAYQLTGLPWDVSLFQAVSAITNTGFTTRSAELVVNSRVRRRITMTLILLGYAAQASIIATILSSFLRQSSGKLALNLVVMVAAVLGLFYYIRIKGLKSPFVHPVRKFLQKRMAQELVHTEELLSFRRGFSISRVEIQEGMPMVGQTLRGSGLREQQIQVLAIERRETAEVIPDPGWVFEVDDRLIVYGDNAKVMRLFSEPEEGSDQGPDKGATG